MARSLVAACALLLVSCAQPAPPADAPSSPNVEATKAQSAPAAAPAPATAQPSVPAVANASAPEPWRRISNFDYAALPIDDMPPDDGYVSAIALPGQEPGGGNVQHLAAIERTLETWRPGRVPDLVQRVRNFLLLLGVADVAQSPLERFLPAIVVRRLLEDVPSDQLAQLMCYVALHPNDGDASVMSDPLLVELGAPDVDPQEVRIRTYFYGTKITRRLIGW